MRPLPVNPDSDPSLTTNTNLARCFVRAEEVYGAVRGSAYKVIARGPTNFIP